MPLEQVVDGEETLKTWGETQGSELLRERIAGGFEWIELAEQEFCDQVIQSLRSGDLISGMESADCPAGYKCEDYSPHLHPTLHEIKVLKQVRTAVAEDKDNQIAVSLHWAIYDSVEGDLDDPYSDAPPGEYNRIQRTELVVTVTAPNGHHRQQDFLIPVESTIT